MKSLELILDGEFMSMDSSKCKLWEGIRDWHWVVQCDDTDAKAILAGDYTAIGIHMNAPVYMHVSSDVFVYWNGSAWYASHGGLMTHHAVAKGADLSKTGSFHPPMKGWCFALDKAGEFGPVNFGASFMPRDMQFDETSEASGTARVNEGSKASGTQKGHGKVDEGSKASGTQKGHGTVDEGKGIGHGRGTTTVTTMSPFGDEIHGDWLAMQDTDGQKRGGWYNKSQHMCELMLQGEPDVVERMSASWYNGRDDTAVDRKYAICDAEADARAPVDDGNETYGDDGWFGEVEQSRTAGKRNSGKEWHGDSYWKSTNNKRYRQW